MELSKKENNMDEFQLTINAPQKQLFNGKAESVNVPSEEGHMTILAGHTPFLANLGAGNIIVKTVAEEKEIKITGGFIEVSEKGVTLLVKTGNIK